MPTPKIRKEDFPDEELNFVVNNGLEADTRDVINSRTNYISNRFRCRS